MAQSTIDDRLVPALTSDATYPRSQLPVIGEEEIPNCPVCDHVGYHPFAAGYDYELESCANRWQFVQCDECTHVWLNPRPVVSALPVIYPPHYYAYNYEATINRVARWGKAQLDRRKLQSIINSLGRRPESYLDIGCGTGRFLRSMEQYGLARQNIYGLELDEAVVEPLRREGYQAWCRRVEECVEIPAESIDLATMFHVIEHVDDPRTVMQGIARWLKPGGVLALETPNLDSWDARKFRETWWGGYHIPRHWNLFSPPTLSRLFEDAGFEVVGCRFLTGHSFWMFSFHHALKYGNPRRPGLAWWFNPFRSLPVLTAFCLLDMFRSTLGARTSAMLMIGRKRS